MTPPHPPGRSHGRPRIRPGEHGTIRVRPVVNRREIKGGDPIPKGAQWRAVANLRLLDGTLIRVEGWGKSKVTAQNTFTKRCHKLLGPGARTLTSRSMFPDAVETYRQWLVTEETKGNKSPTTCDRYRGVLDRYVLPGLCKLELHEVDVSVIEDLLDAVETRGIGASTRRHIRVVIRDILQLAVRRRALSTNPARELSQIRDHKSRKKPRALTPGERDDLLAKLRADTYAVRSSITDLVVFMLGVGCRISEALAVRWCDVDLVGVEVDGQPVPVVSLGPVVVPVRGRGLVRREQGKTGEGEDDRRLVPLPPFAVDMLVLRRPGDAREDDPVFPAQVRRSTVRSGRRYRAASNVQRTWRATRERHGYPWITPHVFRRTAITEWKAMGLGDLQCADLAGHKQVSMTQNTYFGRGTLHPEAVNRPGYDV